MLEAQGDVEQRADLSVDSAAAGRGRIDAGQQLQQRALAGPIAADDPQPLALVDGEVDVFQGLDLERRPLSSGETIRCSTYSLKLMRPNRRTWNRSPMLSS